MNRIINSLFACLFLLQSCGEIQTSPPKEIYNRDFKWKITIPANFEYVEAKEWAKMKNKGSEAVEKTYGEEPIDETKTLFVFKSGQLNYFEANFQPFDTIVDGNYLETHIAVTEMLYETFIAQMPDTKVDTLLSTEIIDDLIFQKVEMKITYPNDMILNMLIYSRLFDKKEFTASVMYVDELKGKKMLAAWKKSTFEKE